MKSLSLKTYRADIEKMTHAHTKKKEWGVVIKSTQVELEDSSTLHTDFNDDVAGTAPQQLYAQDNRSFERSLPAPLATVIMH